MSLLTELQSATISPEMEKHFVERTKRHIGLVQQAAKKIVERLNGIRKIIIEVIPSIERSLGLDNCVIRLLVEEVDLGHIEYKVHILVNYMLLRLPM